MYIIDLIKTIQDQPQVHDFLYKNHSAFLAHIFKMYDDLNKDEIQIGYFSPEDDMIHVFMYDEKLKTTIKNVGEEPFKEPNSKVQELNLDKIKIDLDVALKTAENKLAELKEQASKKMFVLQNLNGENIYNFTFITISLKTVNVKISVETGEIISSNSFSLFDMAKGEKLFTK